MRKQRTEETMMVVLAGSLIWISLAFSTGCDGDGPFSTAPITTKDLNSTCGTGGGVVGTMPCAIDQVK